MISLTPNPFSISPYCQQVSCWFNPDQYSDETLPELGIALPESMAKAVVKRRSAYAAGRYCVSRALQLLGAEPIISLRTNAWGAPDWPPGLIGSITHSEGYASAVVARSTALRSIGIDSEKIISSGRTHNIVSSILNDSETFASNAALFNNDCAYLSCVFSAKESIFKCLHPLVQKFFDFHDAEINFPAQTPGQFRFQLRTALSEEFCAGFEGQGRYAVVGEYVHTAVLLNL